MSLIDKATYSLNAVKNIKEAVKRKTKTVTNDAPLKDYPGFIDAITVADNQEKSVNITSNGTTTVIPDTNKTGLSKVTINTNVNTVNNQEKTVNITANGTTTVTPDANKTGLSKVTINTNVNVQKTLTGAGATSAGGTASSRSTAVSAPPGVSMLIITCVANRAEANEVPAVSGTNITLNTRDAIHSGRIENADIDTTIMKTWACRITNSATAARTVNISWTNTRAIILAASIVKQ